MEKMRKSETTWLQVLSSTIRAGHLKWSGAFWYQLRSWQGHKQT